MRTCILLLLTATLSPALPILTIPNSNSLFEATKGVNFLIPFSITADTTDFLVVNSVQGTVDRGPGEIYPTVDVLSFFVGNFSYAFAPQNPSTQPWTESSTPLLAGQSAGAIASILFPFTATTGLATGTIQLTYELFDLDPFFDANAVSRGTGFLQTTFTVNINDPVAVPEPGFFTLIGFLLILLGVLRTRSH